VQDNVRLLGLLRQAEARGAPARVLPGPAGGVHWVSCSANADGGRRPVSADAVRLPAAARSAEPSAGPPADGLASALLDAARTALNKERAMRQRVRRDYRADPVFISKCHILPIMFYISIFAQRLLS